MKPYPSLWTDRLVLREFTVEDASDVHRLVGEWEVTRMMSDVPHPYEDGMAEEWIAQPTAPRSRPENGLPSP